MNGFTRMIFTGFFAATLLAMPTAWAEREGGEVKEAKGDSQQAKVIKAGKQNLEEIRRMLVKEQRLPLVMDLDYTLVLHANDGQQPEGGGGGGALSAPSSSR